MNRTLTYETWRSEGVQRFGPNSRTWRFVCPVCEHVASVQDWIDAGAPGAAAFSCVGRFLPNSQRNAFGGRGLGPCDYAGGGLFKLNPVLVTFPDGSEIRSFEFADRDAHREGASHE
jgi:hypothetical protein